MEPTSVKYSCGVAESNTDLTSKGAKSTGKDAMSYIYKILMNSLYGRLGINPKYTITEVCDLERYNHLIKTSVPFGAY